MRSSYLSREGGLPGSSLCGGLNHLQIESDMSTGVIRSRKFPANYTHHTNIVSMWTNSQIMI